MVFDTNAYDLIASLIGSFEILQDHRRDNTRTGVLEVLSNDKERFFVKIHNRLSHWNPEVYAYENWTKPLENYAPTLVVSFNERDLFGIIITPIQGRTVNEMQLTDEQKLTEIYYSAGKLFKKMQSNITGPFFGVPNIDGSSFEDNAPTDPVKYIFDSMESWARKVYDKNILDDSYKQLIKWGLKNCDIFKGETPVPTHWDLTQNNWMVDEDGNFTGFIDFENMRWGLSLDSFAVTQERYTFDRPFLLKSFYEGYGLVLDDVTQLKQSVLSINSSLASVYFGHIDNNTRLLDCGIRMLGHIADIVNE